ncbi:MAG: energy-coupled thiamine transporter ThiT [Clostridia bacterium]|nr:energy-coupled thiamine transporter ThiT [Clostridia bacterium]
MKNSKTKIMTECAILVALSTVLSFLKIWNMPWGGSVTLFSMLPVCYISVRHGIKWGLGSSFLYAVIQLFLGITVDGLLGWGLTGGILVSCILLDYIIAFTSLGLSGLFARNGAGVMMGTTLAVAIRFVSHLLSGVYVFASAGKLWEGFETSNTWLYSFVYNGCYMLPELVMTLVGAAIIYKALADRNI